MEFNEKLQELRKRKGLTQEELAKDLYVSRTAVSKWESARGYPSIDSLKEISNYFSVSIDELLSGDKLISIAEKENKKNIRNICDLLFGIVDLAYFLLVFMPIYPNVVNGYVYSINLFSYRKANSFIYVAYIIMFGLLIVCGFIKIALLKFASNKLNEIILYISLAISIVAVLFLSITREVYAVVVAFMLLIIKGILLLKYIKTF